MLKNIICATRRIECLAGRSKIIYALGAHYYKPVIRKEAALAQLTSRDRVLFVGGGACPFSPILLHQATGAFITIIDLDPDCCQKAEALIHKLGLADRMEVRCQNILDEGLDLSVYTVIQLALQVHPLDRVLNRLERQGTAGTRILFRQPKKSLASLYGGAFQAAKTCGSRQLAPHKGRNIGASILYVKGETYEDAHRRAVGGRDGHPLIYPRRSRLGDAAI